MARRLVLGDVHGAYRALVQVLERAQVDRENDRVIFVGDVADGWPETPRCIDELLRLKEFVGILGNHDYWLLRYLKNGIMSPDWLRCGGTPTLRAYGAAPDQQWSEHRRFLDSWKPWHQEDDVVFTHGGWDLEDGGPMNASEHTLMWDRTLWNEAVARHFRGRVEPLTRYREAYIGHTTTELLSFPDGPVCCCGIWNVDQGAGWGGKLTLMDMDTKEWWQSDRVLDLYPEAEGRPGRAFLLAQEKE